VWLKPLEKLPLGREDNIKKENVGHKLLGCEVNDNVSLLLQNRVR
jgi:hypothetical protein